MNWGGALAACFVLWSVYAIPGNIAEKTHGVAVNMGFETLAFAGVSLLMSRQIIENLPKVTMLSGLQGMMMGAGSAVGFYFFLKSMSLAPGAASLALVFLVAGVTFPIQGALYSFFGGDALETRQWVAIAGMVGCIVLYNWKF